VTPQPPAAAGPPPAPAPPVRAGVGVGVGVLVLHEGLVLLGRRLGAHGAGTWAAPGGRLEFGEGIEACAARELREETGLSARVLELGPYTNDVFVPEQQHFVTIFVVARSIVGTPRNLEPARCEGWAWFPWDDWPRPLFQPLQSLRQIGWRPGGA
jgi:8-oxo-dGTP diphosphatase